MSVSYHSNVVNSYENFASLVLVYVNSSQQHVIEIDDKLRSCVLNGVPYTCSRRYHHVRKEGKEKGR
jgi:hypothetical protein